LAKPITVPKLWPGSTIYIIGGGPSINDVDLSTIHDERIIGVNNAYGDPMTDAEKVIGMHPYQPRGWVDVCWWGDLKWFRWHRPYLRQFKGLVMHCNENTNMAKINWVKQIRRSRAKAVGLEKSPSVICWNKNSGTSAINLAYHLGAKRVVLLGFDMRVVDNRKNYHADHIGERNINPFDRYLPAFKAVAKDAEKFGLEIINATPNSAIQEFPITTLEDFLNGQYDAKQSEQEAELASSDSEADSDY
jgi:hypothetical protein